MRHNRLLRSDSAGPCNVLARHHSRVRAMLTARWQALDAQILCRTHNSTLLCRRSHREALPGATIRRINCVDILQDSWSPTDSPLFSLHCALLLASNYNPLNHWLVGERGLIPIGSVHG